jgi:hypothetical protein
MSSPAPAAGSSALPVSPQPAPAPASVSLQPVFTAAQICAVLPRHPRANIETNWPLLSAALRNYCDDSRPTVIAAIATVGVETGSFAPIKERGGPAYFTKLYEGRKDLGNCEPGDGAKYCGRGFVQITGRWDYKHFGAELGVDLEADPQRALDPAIGAGILALFFRERRIPAAAAAGNWEKVRRLVNGGLNGWADFKQYVDALSRA